MQGRSEPSEPDDDDEAEDGIDGLIELADCRWELAQDELLRLSPVAQNILDDPNGFLRREVCYRHDFDHRGLAKECINPACSTPWDQDRWRVEQVIDSNAERRKDAFWDGDELDGYDEDLRLVLFPKGLKIRGKSYVVPEDALCPICVGAVYEHRIAQKKTIDKLLTKVCKRICAAIDEGEKDERLRKTLRKLHAILMEVHLPLPKPKGAWWQFWNW